jgi:hypothetical protein
VRIRSLGQAGFNGSTPAGAHDTLAGDQQLVVDLVLQRGRDYDEVARLLSTDRLTVRDLALSALEALEPHTYLTAVRRAMISDYLLGQLPPRMADDVRQRLAHVTAERDWAQTVAAKLARLESVQVALNLDSVAPVERLIGPPVKELPAASASVPPAPTPSHLPAVALPTPSPQQLEAALASVPRPDEPGVPQRHKVGFLMTAALAVGVAVGRHSAPR